MPFVTWSCECRSNHVAVAQSRDADPAYSEWSGRLPGGGTGPKRNLSFVCRGKTHFLLKVLSWRIWEWDSDLVCCICGGILGCLYVVGRRGQRGNALPGTSGRGCYFHGSVVHPRKFVLPSRDRNNRAVVVSSSNCNNSVSISPWGVSQISKRGFQQPVLLSVCARGLGWAQQHLPGQCCACPLSTACNRLEVNPPENPHLAIPRQGVQEGEDTRAPKEIAVQ